jgi:transcription initiation factor TFIIIB Brf1 subunit/transcription initiation factor TFIIB
MTRWWCPSCEKYPEVIGELPNGVVECAVCGNQVVRSNIPHRPWWRKLLRLIPNPWKNL